MKMQVLVIFCNLIYLSQTHIRFYSGNVKGVLRICKSGRIKKKKKERYTLYDDANDTSTIATNMKTPLILPSGESSKG